MGLQKSIRPSFLLSLLPLLFLILLLTLNIVLFKDESTAGPNQLALLLAGVLAAVIGIWKLKISYKKIEDQVVQSISLSMQANLILLVVGALIGLWILSGVVPTMIYYGLKLLNPSFFLPVSCIICAIVSLGTGSSWSTTGTIGIALIAIGKTLGIPSGMVAGAIISGAYFGDKMSPLSDTTNLAPAMAGTDLMTHIRHMMYTSVPAIFLALIGFTTLGLFYDSGQASQAGGNIAEVMAVLEKNFHIGWHLLFIPMVIMVLVKFHIPALPALIMGGFLGAISSVVFQNDLLIQMSQGDTSIMMAYKQILAAATSGFSLNTGNELLDSLINRGGMGGMINTIWLIISAMVFGGCLEACGMLEVMANGILKLVRGAGSLVGATLGSCLLMNLTASDQYLAIVVPGRMFQKAFDRFGLHPKNLSRSLEDAGTVTSVLIPWNSGGAYNSAVLGVSTFTYLPYCFFNILSPIISVFLASMNLTLEKVYEENGLTEGPTKRKSMEQHV